MKSKWMCKDILRHLCSQWYTEVAGMEEAGITEIPEADERSRGKNSSQ